jgi:hypothetical protein
VYILVYDAAAAAADDDDDAVREFGHLLPVPASYVKQ